MKNIFLVVLLLLAGTGTALSQDSIPYVKGKKFEINGIKVYWEYFVSPASWKPESDEFYISSQNLIESESGRVILTGKKDESRLIDTSFLAKDEAGIAQLDDYNFDGYIDVAIYCHICSGSMGKIDYVYLFDPATKSFEHSEELSGSNILLNKESKSLSQLFRSGGAHQFGFTLYFGDNAKIERSELYVKEDNVFTFTKKVGDKVVDEIIETVDEDEAYLFLEWVEKQRAK